MQTIFCLVVIAFCSTDVAVKATKCLECIDMPTPMACHVATTCLPTELCYVEEVISSGGLILYNSGCLSQTRCKNRKRGIQQLLGNGKYHVYKSDMRRQAEVSKTDIDACIECCHGDFCNSQGCGQTDLSRPQRGPKCFSCGSQASPDSCRDIEECDEGQVCGLYKPNIAQPLWKSECMNEHQCRAIQTVQSQMGKRSERSINTCMQCCTDDYCNHDCTNNFTTTPTTTTTTTTGSTTHVTASTTKLPIPTHHITSTPISSLVYTATTKMHSHSTVATTSLLGKTTQPTQNHHQTPKTTQPTQNHHQTPKTTQPTQNHHQTHGTTKPTQNHNQTHGTTHPTHNHHQTTSTTAKPTHNHHQTHGTTKPTHHHQTHGTTKPTHHHQTHGTTKPTHNHHNTHGTTHPTHNHHQTNATTHPTQNHHNTHKTTTPIPAHSITKATTKHTMPHNTTKATAAHTVASKATVLPTVKTTYNHDTHTVVMTTQTTFKPTTSDPAVACHADRYIYDTTLNLCLKFETHQKLNWTDAQIACESNKGKLAIITNVTKSQDIAKFLENYRQYHGVAFWVGANDKGNAHLFHWLDGTPYIIDNTVNLDLTAANCLYVNDPDPTSLNFKSCTEKMSFICERLASVRAK